MIKAGDIVLIEMPQADGKSKKRPALILCKIPPYNDYLICGISSQLRNKVDKLDFNSWPKAYQPQSTPRPSVL